MGADPQPVVQALQDQHRVRADLGFDDMEVTFGVDAEQVDEAAVADRTHRRELPAGAVQAQVVPGRHREPLLQAMFGMAGVVTVGGGPRSPSTRRPRACGTAQDGSGPVNDTRRRRRVGGVHAGADPDPAALTLDAQHHAAVAVPCQVAGPVGVGELRAVVGPASQPVHPRVTVTELMVGVDDRVGVAGEHLGPRVRRDLGDRPGVVVGPHGSAGRTMAHGSGSVPRSAGRISTSSRSPACARPYASPKSMSRCVSTGVPTTTNSSSDANHPNRVDNVGVAVHACASRSSTPRRSARSRGTPRAAAPAESLHAPTLRTCRDASGGSPPSSPAPPDAPASPLNPLDGQYVTHRRR